ncbi:MAG: saccharopine dehydrogenase C-terminal domain-containing protein, partial [Flavitalea sp.]
MKHILLFGAGKSATFLINYLVAQVMLNPWKLTVADNDQQLLDSKLKQSPKTIGIAINVTNNDERANLIKDADVVISLLPPFLHKLIASDCLRLGKNMLTASYLDEQMRSMEQEIKEKGLTFLCEMGLDPGIDHMSAMALINKIKNKGGEITGFKSHCGGLVAPHCDDNPWRYKISWNPRNVVNAGKAGADFILHGKPVHLPYEELFEPSRLLRIGKLDSLSWYPNRDSVSYAETYNLKGVDTFIRTTLRYPEFTYGWSNLIQLGLTKENVFYETDGMSLRKFFKDHLDANNFGEWLSNTVTSRFEESRELLEKVTELLDAELEAGREIVEALEDMMMIDHDGKLKSFTLDTIKREAAVTVASRMHEANLALKQLIFLGLADDKTLINKGRCSAADILLFILERKLMLLPGETDMVLMLHEVDYKLNGRKFRESSSLIVIGEDHVNTAMAETVGLPLG